MRVRGLAGLLLASLVSQAVAAPDDPPLTDEPAEPGAVLAGASLRAEGDALGKAGKYELALGRFREAARAHPSALHDCYVALTYFHLGGLTSARLYLDSATRRGDPLPGWCGKRLDETLAAQLARRGYLPVTIAVTPPDAIVGTGELRVRGTRRWWLPPGAVVVTAERDGYATMIRDDVIPTAAPAGGVAIALTLQPLPAAPVAPVAPLPGPRRWPAYLVLAGGAALVAGGAGFHVAALGTKDEANQLYARDPRFAAIDERFERQRALALGGYAVGAAAIATGVYLIVRSRRDRPRRDVVDVALGRDHVVVSATWSMGGR